MLSWMETTRQEYKQLRNATKLPIRGALKCLRFKMVDGVPLVLRQIRHLINMEHPVLASLTVKVDHRLIKFIPSEVKS